MLIIMQFMKKTKYPATVRASINSLLGIGPAEIQPSHYTVSSMAVLEWPTKLRNM